MSFEDIIGVEYGPRTLLKSNVKFITSDNRVFISPIFSGVRATKIDKSLFSVAIRGDFDFTMVKVSPGLKFGTKKCTQGALVTTNNNSVLFIPMDTLKLIQKKVNKENLRVVTCIECGSKKKSQYKYDVCEKCNGTMVYDVSKHNKRKKGVVVDLRS